MYVSNPFQLSIFAEEIINYPVRHYRQYDNHEDDEKTLGTRDMQ